MYSLHSYDGVQQYDRFKTVVLMLLVALLIPVLWLGRDAAIPSTDQEQENPLTSAAKPADPAPLIGIDAPADGSTFSTDSATLIGTGHAGDKVEVQINGKVAGEVTVAVDGGWRYDLSMAEPGDYRLVARMLAADGSERAATEPIIITRLPQLKPMATPVITAPAPNAAVVAGSVEFRGTGELTRDVVLVLDGKEIGRTTVGTDGSWSMAAAVEIAEHDVHVYTLDESGNALMSTSVHFSVLDAADSAAVDADGDGVAGDRDKCGDTKPGETVDESGCTNAVSATVALALTDADVDGVGDADDRCADTPANVKVDAAGCPLSGETIMTLTGVTFEINEAQLRAESTPSLGKALKMLQDNPTVIVTIEGHTDDRGDAAYNQYLSQQRAESVRQYLIEHGIAEERMEAVGRGEEYPLVPNTNELERKQNRRVEMVVK